MDRLLRLQFIANVGGQFRELQSPTALVFAAGQIGAFVAAQHFKPHRNAGRLAIPHHFEMDGVPGPFLSDQHLQLTGVGDRLSIECGNHISGAQAGFRSGCIRLNFANHRSLSFLHVEELRVVGSHVGNLHSDKRMRDLAVANQRLDGRLHYLRGMAKPMPAKDPEEESETC